MIRGRKVTETTTRVKRTHHCEFCGENLENESRGWHGNEASVEARVGDQYPEVDTRRCYELDVCSACFLAKVKPAIEALGVKFRERDAEDYDYVDEMKDEAQS